jgi:hypothetical protein
MEGVPNIEVMICVTKRDHSNINCIGSNLSASPDVEVVLECI